jgi:uncharacterized protein
VCVFIFTVMKKIILTGASSGLWASLAQVFHQAGYEVIWLCRSQPESFVKWIETDLTSEPSLQSAIAEIKSNFSQFELMIQCAWDGYGEAIDTLDWQKSEHTFRLNAIAPIVLTSSLLGEIKENQADIINIWATIGFKPYHHFSVYGSSKWAMRWWTENLQLELKSTPCRVIWVHPGGIDTAGNDRRRGEITEITGKGIGWGFMSADDIASFILQIYHLPKNMEVSEVIINRK